MRWRLVRLAFYMRRHLVKLLELLVNSSITTVFDEIEISIPKRKPEVLTSDFFSLISIERDPSLFLHSPSLHHSNSCLAATNIIVYFADLPCSILASISPIPYHFLQLIPIQKETICFIISCHIRWHTYVSVFCFPPDRAQPAHCRESNSLP